AVERIITHGLSRSLLHPGIESSSQRLSFVLNCKVDQRCCSTKRCSARPSFKIIRAGGSTEWHVEVCMNVDSAGENIISSGVYHLLGVFTRKSFRNRGDLAVANGNITGECVRRRYDASVCNDRVKTHVCRYSSI